MNDRANSVGFIGLGAMGGPMARNASESGLEVYIYDKVQASVDRAVEWGGISCGTVGEMAEKVDLIVTVLPADAHVLDIAIGDEGIFAHPTPPAIFDFSTIGPWTFQAVSDAAHARGLEAYSGALTKGVAAAEAGTLALYVDNNAQRNVLCMRVIEAISDSVIYTGDSGTSKVVKLINNLVVGVNVALLAEAVSVAHKAGIEPASLLRALELGSSCSFAMKSHFIQYALRDDLGPGRFSTRYIIKDLKIAAEMARLSGMTTFFGSLATAYYRGACATGHANDYYPAVWDWTDAISGVEQTKGTDVKR